MSRRRGLGKGLDALIPSGDTPSADEIVHLSVEVIERNPRQPRRQFDSDDLKELADSIREHGVLQPLMVARPEGSDDYVLIAGERRLQAARQAGLSSVPVVVREATEEQLLVWALIENLQREDLNPIEAAEGYQQLAEDFDLSHEQIAQRVGKSRSAVSNTLRLLNLPESIRTALESGLISEGHARALLSLPNEEAQTSALDTMISQELNVRQAEALVRRLTGRRKQTRRTKPERSPEEKALEADLREALGTKVSLRRSGESGTLTLHFYSDEELNALLERFLGDDS